MILVIVYVGAVAVLFLFVVMMLDINFAELREGFLRYLPVGAMIGLVLLVEILLSGWAAGRQFGDAAERWPRLRAPGAGDRQHRAPRPRALHRTTSTCSRRRAWCCWSP